MRERGFRNRALVAGEGGCNILRDVALYFEQVCCGAIVAFRPNIAARSGINELGGHSNLVATRLNAALKHVADAEIAADVSYVPGLPL
jgi:hypothetical protein